MNKYVFLIIIFSFCSSDLITARCDSKRCSTKKCYKKDNGWNDGDEYYGSANWASAYNWNAPSVDQEFYWGTHRY